MRLAVPIFDIIGCCCLLLLFSHINSCQKSRVRGHTKEGAGALGKSEKPNEINIRPGNTTISRLKTHDMEDGAQVKRSNVQTELTWPHMAPSGSLHLVNTSNYIVYLITYLHLVFCHVRGSWRWRALPSFREGTNPVHGLFQHTMYYSVDHVKQIK